MSACCLHAPEALTLTWLAQENHAVARLLLAQDPTKEASRGLLIIAEPLQFDVGEEAAMQTHISDPMQPSDTSKLCVGQAAITVLSLQHRQPSG